jgi:hypothetical protein
MGGSRSGWVLGVDMGWGGTSSPLYIRSHYGPSKELCQREGQNMFDWGPNDIYRLHTCRAEDLCSVLSQTWALTKCAAGRSLLPSTFPAHSVTWGAQASQQPCYQHALFPGQLLSRALQWRASTVSYPARQLSIWSSSLLVAPANTWWDWNHLQGGRPCLSWR